MSPVCRSRLGADADACRLVGNALELGFIELLSECLTLSDQAGVGSEKLMELIQEQHRSPALMRYAKRITQNKFDSEGGFNLGGGITDARLVVIGLPPPLPSLLDEARSISWAPSGLGL